MVLARLRPLEAMERAATENGVLASFLLTICGGFQTMSMPRTRQVRWSQKKTRMSIIWMVTHRRGAEELSNHRQEGRFLPGKTFQTSGNIVDFKFSKPAIGATGLILHSFFCPEANAEGWQSIC